MCKEAGIEPSNRPDWFVEHGTSAEREPFGDSLATVTTKARYYYYKFDQVLAAPQLAHAHGFPKEHSYDDISENQSRQLLGNSVFLPHLTIAVVAAWVNEYAPWHGASYRDSMLSRATSASTPNSSVGVMAPPSTSAKKRRLSAPL